MAGQVYFTERQIGDRILKVARKRYHNQEERLIHNIVSPFLRERFHSRDENGEEFESGLIEKLPNENEQNDAHFDTVKCTYDSIQMNMDANPRAWNFIIMMRDQKRFFDMLRKVSLGLRYLGMFDVNHRDLKPEHVFLTRNYTVKIGGFGSAEIAPNNHVKKQRMVQDLSDFANLTRTVYNFLFGNQINSLELNNQLQRSPDIDGVVNMDFINDNPDLPQNNFTQAQEIQPAQIRNNRIIEGNIFDEFVAAFIDRLNQANNNNVEEEFDASTRILMENFLNPEREFNVASSSLFSEN